MPEDPPSHAEADQTELLGAAPVDAPQVGDYRLLQKLGEGGMGEVWEAEQLRPVRRRVALKLIKPGMDSALVIARFESERQALALMDHPAIARVFDAGTTEGGRPYFVMELVHGIRLTKYCDRHHLAVSERLELFIQVCEGIQHAHQKAIIHRDVKPSNILVTEQGGRPVPKIIDFGVAKATAQRLTERTLFTELGQLIGTPEYMSPEQAELTGEDIDIRTDVYSLGMVLYELLAGSLPFDSNELRQAGLLELQKRILEGEPTRPSLQITAKSVASDIAAENRNTTPAALSKSLQGDLDWIVLKALDKDRSRRYETAHALALDVQRFLDNEPVEARAPTATYRIGKFIRRHRVGVAALSFAMLSLLVAIIVTSLSLLRTKRAEETARAEADRATAVTAFLETMLSSADPAQDGREVRVVEVIDRASEEIGSEFADQPETEASVRETLGKTLLSLGQYEAAAAQFEDVYRIRSEHLGRGHPMTLQSGVAVAASAWYKGELERAVEIGRRSLLEATEFLGPTHAVTLQATTDLAVFLDSLGRLEEALPLHRFAFDAALAAYGLENEVTLVAANNLAISLKDLGEWEEAETLYRASLEARTNVNGPDHPETLNVKHNLAMFLTKQGNSAEAVKLHREVFEAKVRIMGPEHPKVLSSMNGLALALTAEGEYEEAIAIYQQVDALAARQYPETHRVRHVYRRHYGACLLEAGRLAEAEEILILAHRGLTDTLGESHANTLEVAQNLVALYESQGRAQEAARYRVEE